jgi:predicted ATPase
MFKKLKLLGFKSFERAVIPLGPLTLLVGTNASGKSNVRDALRFLHGCAQGFTLTEVMDEKWGPGGFLLWRGIRGGAREIAWSGGDRFHLEVEIELSPGKRYRQLISVGFREDPRVPEVIDEALEEGDRFIFETSDFRLGRTQATFPNGNPRIRSYSAGRSIVSQVAGDEEADKGPRDKARLFAERLKSARFLDLAPDAMREPTAPGQEILGDRGEHLSAVLLHITSDESKKEALLDWLKLLTPLDVVDLRFHEDLLGRVLVYLAESNGREISAQSASDGTLRFLALTAALLSSESGQLFFIEEIDNGLHPTRLHLLLDVIEQATRGLGCQVIATTHNPQLLAYLSKEAREDAILLYRREHENASQAVRILDLPDIRRVLSSQDLGRLFATGWFEDTVEFTATPELEPALASSMAALAS